MSLDKFLRAMHKSSYYFVELEEIEKYYQMLKKGKTIKIPKYSGLTKELATSGSTDGIPKYATIDKEQLEARFAAEWYTMEWTGEWEWMKDNWAHLWYPSVRAHSESPMDTGKLALRRKVEKCLFLSYFDLDENMSIKYYERLKEFQPKLLVGYSEALYQFAEHLKKNKLSLDIPAVISSGGELKKEWRTTIEGTLTKKLFNRYGCSEFGVIAMEKVPGSGILHVVTQRGLMVDQVGGKIIITDRINKTRKFRNYWLGDRGKVRGNGSIIRNLKGKIKGDQSYLRIRRD
jgi:phenylacetate-coenzyme A ligase PaaK-like adenylate-forming protein